MRQKGLSKKFFKAIDKIDKVDFPPYFSENHRSEAKKRSNRF